MSARRAASTHVLDASALLALLLGENGADMVSNRGPAGLISAVNLSEVVAKLVDRGAPPAMVGAELDRLNLSVVPFDRDRAWAAGLLRASTRGRDISFGDRACLALGLEMELPVVTGDRSWVDLGLRLDIILIR